MTEQYTHPDHDKPQEITQGNCRVLNLSGQNFFQIKENYPREIWELAENLTIMPDFCPGRSTLPTGSVLTLRESRYPEYRELLTGDIGCGMALLSSNIPFSVFISRLDLWDKLAQELKNNKGNLGDLGSGNHFLDALSTGEHGFVSFLVHTGSRNQSTKPLQHLDSPHEFDQEYDKAQDWAKQNRQSVLDLLQQVYTPLQAEFTSQLDMTHNTHAKKDGQVTIYKGSNSVQPEQLAIIPSSLAGPAFLVRVKNNIEQINNALPHGTGRLRSRSEEKTFLHNSHPDGEYNFPFRVDRPYPDTAQAIQAFRKHQVYIPKFISNRSIGTENPHAYRNLSVLKHTKPFFEVLSVRYPIAYIGQL